MTSEMCCAGNRTVALALYLLSLMTGCAGYGKEPLIEPVVQVRDFKITNVHLSGFEGLMTLNVKNPNNIKLKASELNYTLFIVEQELVRGQSRDKFTIPANDEEEIRLPVEMSFSSLLEILPKIANTGVASYAITGDVKTGIATVPFTKNGEFKLPFIPTQLKEI